MVFGLTSPDKSRYMKDLDQQIQDLRDIVYTATPSVNASDIVFKTGGTGSNQIPDVDGLFGFKPYVEYVGIKASYTSGTGDGNVEDIVTTSSGSWEGIYDGLIEGDDENGSLFLINNNANTFNVSSTQNLRIGTSPYTWSATYTVNSAIIDCIYLEKTTVFVDSKTGNPEIANILQEKYLDGQLLFIRPIEGKTLTLKSGGNINIQSNVTVEDDSFTILQFYKNPFQKWDSTVAYSTGDKVSYNKAGYECISNTTAGDEPDNPTHSGKWRSYEGMFNVLSSYGSSSVSIPSGSTENEHLEWDNTALSWNAVQSLTFGATGNFADSGFLRFANDQIVLSGRNSGNTGNVEVKLTDLVDITESNNGSIGLQVRSQHSTNPDSTFYVTQSPDITGTGGTTLLGSLNTSSFAIELNTNSMISMVTSPSPSISVLEKIRMNTNEIYLDVDHDSAIFSYVDDIIQFATNNIIRMALSNSQLEMGITLNMNNNDITMGTGEISAGGATKEINNIGELVFVNNTLTPAGNGIIYFDGTDLKAKTGSTTVNLTNIGGANFTDAVFRVTDELYPTKMFAVDVTGNSIGVVTTLDFNASSSRTYSFPDVTGTVITDTGSQTISGSKTFSNNIIAGGAGDGMSNIGHLDFINNLATPVSGLSIYSDGTSLIANTNSAVGNLVITPAMEILDMNSHRITGLLNPINPTDAVNVDYFNVQGDLTWLALDGTSTMSGDIDVGNNSIENVNDIITVRSDGTARSTITSGTSTSLVVRWDLVANVDWILSDALTTIIEYDNSADQLRFGNSGQYTFATATTGSTFTTPNMATNSIYLNNTNNPPQTAGGFTLDGSDVKVYSGGSVRNLSDIGSGGGITASDNVTWTGTHTFNNNVTIGSSSTLSINGSIGTDTLPNFDNIWNLGSGTKRWAGFFSTRYRFDATERSIILNSNNIDYIINSSSGDHRFFNNGTSFPEITITDGAVVVNGGNRIRSGGSTEIGYYVTNATSTVGNAGTNQLPYISSTMNTPSSLVLDQWFGSENGCCGIQYYSSGSQHRFWAKSNGSWVKTFFT